MRRTFLKAVILVLICACAHYPEAIDSPHSFCHSYDKWKPCNQTFLRRADNPWYEKFRFFYGSNKSSHDSPGKYSSDAQY